MSELDEIREALSAVRLGVWSWDIGRDVIRWSDEMCRLFGRAPGFAPASLAEYLAALPGDERGSVDATIRGAFERAIATRSSTSYALEHRVALPGGDTRWIEGRGRVVVDGEGRPIRVVGAGMDITARKQTEHRLRRTEEIHRLIGEVASDYVYTADFRSPTLVPEIVAGSFERTTGMTVEDVQKKGGWMEVIHPDDRSAIAAVAPLLETGQPLVSEYRIVHPSGEVRWLRDSVRPILDPATGELVRLIGGVQDVTKQKSLEAQLLQAQKLEALARLSGGIAHDFNNLLSVIVSGVSLLQTDALDDGQRESLEAIARAAARGTELTRSLLVFARKDAGSPQIVSVSDVVRAALPMLTRAAGAAITLRLHTSEGDAARGTPSADLVRIDPGQAQLLLLNLVVNARDAMPSGGAVDLRVEVGRYAAADGLPGELDPGGYVRLTVADTGAGIAPEVLPRIFEPFFTTKPRGRGTGLGLAACHGIVQHAGGAVTVTSVLGRGARFEIYLPLLDEAARQGDEVVARVSVGGVERLLLVEDEPELRRLLGRCLVDRGYAVRAASSAEEALTLLAEEPVDLLVTDVVLPGQHGNELALEVRRRWPDTRVLLVSGYVGDGVVSADLPLLSKPFTIESLARKVRELLDAAPTARTP